MQRSRRKHRHLFADLAARRAALAAAHRVARCARANLRATIVFDDREVAEEHGHSGHVFAANWFARARTGAPCSSLSEEA